MKKIPKNIQYVSIGLSLMFFLLLNFRYKTVHEIWNILESVCHCYLAISTNTFDHLVFAGIPIFGMLLTTNRERFTPAGLIYDNLIIIGSVLLTIFLAIYLLTIFGRPTNPLVPDYLLSEPFNSYSILTVGIGVAVPFILMIKWK